MRTFLFLLFAVIGTVLPAQAQVVVAQWGLNDPAVTPVASLTGSAATLVTTDYLEGSAIARKEVMTGSNAADGYTATSYDRLSDNQKALLANSTMLN
ncbi:MAG: hypothetical protein HUK02_03000, partial [Bacteroidaceae bacterium]|nr:hypothetical protein [Bacteroidaceae bacterium]